MPSGVEPVRTEDVEQLPLLDRLAVHTAPAQVAPEPPQDRPGEADRLRRLHAQFLAKSVKADVACCEARRLSVLRDAEIVCRGFEWPSESAGQAMALLPRLRAFSGADTVEISKLHGSFSGAMVLLAKPVKLGQELPRTVRKTRMTDRRLS